jgi:hypothetical protein
MNFNAEIEIDLPRAEVLHKLTNTDNYRFWHDGFHSAEHISGEIGQFGAKMKLIYRFGDKQKIWIETITKRDLPFQMHANYSNDGLINFQRNYFNENSEGVTKWISKNEFIPTNFKMRLITIFMPGVFQKQILKQMKKFKKFAEENQSLPNATN